MELELNNYSLQYLQCYILNSQQTLKLIKKPGFWLYGCKKWMFWLLGRFKDCFTAIKNKSSNSQTF